MNLNKFISCSGLLFLFLIAGCHSSKNSFEGQVIKKLDLPKDISIPKNLFEEISKDLKAEGSSVEPVFLFVPLEVLFTSESTEVMVSTRKYIFGNGGGFVDFSDFLLGLGSFYMSFPEEQFEKYPALEHLYYISQVPRRDIDGESFGLGCGKWVDLKNSFSKLKNKTFLKLNSVDQRHLFTAAGYYIFVFRKGHQVYLSHLNLTDSRFKDRQCEIPKSISSERESSG